MPHTGGWRQHFPETTKTGGINSIYDRAGPFPKTVMLIFQTSLPPSEQPYELKSILKQ